MATSKPRFGPVRVMMVCTGNICRSPMAEIVLRTELEKAGLSNAVVIDSTGISSYEQGNPIDHRARTALADRGYDVHKHSARQARPGDLFERELILAMTASHANALRKMTALGTSSSAPDDIDSTRVRMFRAFDPAMAETIEREGFIDSDLDLADPWYGGPEDFELCLDQIEAATPAIVEHLRDLIEAPADERH